MKKNFFMLVKNSRNTKKVSNSKNTILTIENKTINLQKDIKPLNKAFFKAPVPSAAYIERHSDDMISF